MKTFKNISLVALLALCMGFSFGTKDEKYYIENPDKAKSKVSTCDKIIGKLAESGNIDKLEKMIEDPECNAANNALNKIKKEQAKAERQKRAKLREKEERLAKVKLKKLHKE